MEALLRSLKESMERQLNLLEVMKAIEQTKNEILTQGRLFDFSGLNDNISQLIKENISLEKERDGILRKLCGHIKIQENQELTLRVLLKNIENNKLKDELVQMSELLKEKVNSIKYYTKVNQDLIEAVIQVIDLSLNQGVLTSKDIDYTQNVRMRKDRPLLVNKVI